MLQFKRTTNDQPSVEYIHTYIHLIITDDTPHSGTMIYAETLRNSSVSRYGKSMRVMKLQPS